MKIDIPQNFIRAALLFAGKADIRYYLNGLALQTGPEGSRLIGTDGHTLCVVDLGIRDLPVLETIIPRSLLEKLKAKAGSKVTIEIAETPKGQRTIAVTHQGQGFSEIEINGAFPDWRRVIPRKTTGQLAHYNPHYLVRLDDAWHILNAGTSRGSGHRGGKVGACPAYNGDSSSLNMLHPQVLALVFPLRWDTEPTSAPDWAYASLNPPPDTAPAAKPEPAEVPL